MFAEAAHRIRASSEPVTTHGWIAWTQDSNEICDCSAGSCRRGHRGGRIQHRAGPHRAFVHPAGNCLRFGLEHRAREHRAVRPGRPDAQVARRPALHRQSGGAERHLRRGDRRHPVVPFRRKDRRTAHGNVEPGLLVRLLLFRGDFGRGEPGAGAHQHHRAARASELRHRAVSFPGRGKPLRAVRRYRGIDRTGRAARRHRDPSLSRPDLPPARPLPSWIIAARFSIMSATR